MSFVIVLSHGLFFAPYIAHNVSCWIDLDRIENYTSSAFIFECPDVALGKVGAGI